MSNTYYGSDTQKPKFGDIIIDMEIDSPCIVTRTYGWKFERVKIGPKAKQFKPVMSNWSKPASSFKFIEHQDNVEWPFKYTQMNPNVTCAGDIFMDKDDHSVYYMAINLVNSEATYVSLIDLTSDSPHTTMIDSSLTTVWFIGNQNMMPVPQYTKDALEFLFKNNKHFPVAGDIYSDKYNSLYQVVEMPSDTCTSVILAGMQPKSYHPPDHEWPMNMYKEQAAYNFFEKATFICTPDETLHAPNIGDIYIWAKNRHENQFKSQYMIVTDISDKYLAPSLIYIDKNYASLDDLDNDYDGEKWDSIEQFINHTVDESSWNFLENQDDIEGGPENKTINKWGEKFSAYAISPVKKEQIKLGTLLAYVPSSTVYHDCLVVTTGSEGFSVWWLAFEGGNDDLQEGFKQTFKFDKHLPLFLYNGHQNDFLKQGQPTLEGDMKEMEETVLKDLEAPLMVPLSSISGKVEGHVPHTTEDIPVPLHKLMEGVILNYYPYKDMQLPKKQSASFWTLLVIEIGGTDHQEQFKVMVLDKGTAPHPPNIKENYWFNLDTYLKGDQGSLKYVMHMNDTSLLTNEEEDKYFNILTKLKDQGISVSHPI